MEDDKLMGNKMVLLPRCLEDITGLEDKARKRGLPVGILKKEKEKEKEKEILDKINKYGVRYVVVAVCYPNEIDTVTNYLDGQVTTDCRFVPTTDGNGCSKRIVDMEKYISKLDWLCDPKDKTE